ncbi:Chromosome segregation ATPase [Klebsiella pneumoniae]|nr:Chromosome segregation ATPase [Klebsiella pneumoniae]
MTRRFTLYAYLYREDVDFVEMGMFEPHFDFDTSEEFKEAIKDIRNEQKALLRLKNRSGAIWCGTDWTVHNSRAEGKKMTTRAINLTARAFNGECDAAIANCTFKNWSVMHDRIQAAFDKINALNEVNDVHISKEYLRLKLKELDLVHAYKMKKQSEKEEQREIRAQMAEERKAQQEIERAIREAEVEELRAQKALDKARKEMESKLAQLTAEQAEKYQSKIDELRDALTEAELKGQKALSMAQQTKRGHVYIISNMGSFGENVFKIGMTRRLDPQDRVDELGSASVPFLFDVHAMIHSEDAPALENALHQHFDAKRTNLVNRRKEFFNVSLKEIKSAVYELAGNDVDFIETVVAQHYYETLALRKKQSGMVEVQAQNTTVQPRFAESI